jgi:hypothetical protein
MRTLLLAALLTAPSGAQILVAEYSAGDAGSPPTAPDPQTQGWTLTDPSNGGVVLIDLSPDGATGSNAWLVDDQVTFSGGRAHYGQVFDPADLDVARDWGWELSSTLRLVQTNGLCVVIDFATGTAASEDRYLLWLEVQGVDVLASSNLTGASIVCPGAMDGAYHTFALRKPAGAANTAAEFLFDGAVLGAWPATSSSASAPAGGLNWGSGSSGGTGTANWNRVTFHKGTDVIQLGSPYCGPANLNSTGQPGMIEAWGSPIADAGLLSLVALQLPTNQMGYFVLGDGQTFISSPGGSQGNLCVGGKLGRFVGQVGSTGTSGTLSIDVDTSALPTWRSTPLLAGQTWNFQAWFKDHNPGATSNFTDGVSITFS